MHDSPRLAVLCGSFVVILGDLASAQVPQGFEIVEIAPSPYYRGSPAINNCGEIVYSQNGSLLGSGDVLLYDNGKVSLIADEPGHDTGPDINNNGSIVWTRDDDGQNGDIVLYEAGQLLLVARGTVARLNSSEHVAWNRITAETCAYESAVHLWDGPGVWPVSDNPLSNQGQRLSDLDVVTWTKYEFCASPWTSEIMLYTNTITQKLPSISANPQIPTLNNLGQVAWGSQNGIELWENGVALLLTSWGRNPDLNNLGEIYFLRWHQISSVCCWQPWLYRPDNGGEFLRLVDDQLWNTDGENNDWGEIVWRWLYSPYSDEGGLRYMRRIRTGEADFDGDIDLDDAAVLHDCLTGPGDFDRLCDCRFLDLDHDRDVDLADFARFQRAYTGS